MLSTSHVHYAPPSLDPKTRIMNMMATSIVTFTTRQDLQQSARDVTVQF